MSATEMDIEHASPEEVLKHAYYQYSDAGLRTPPIPREMLGQLGNFAPWRYGTRDVNPADRVALAAEAADPSAADYLVFGHVGHGTTSWSIVARLLVGPLAVFVRHPWGGATGDREAESVPVHRSFTDMEELIVKAQNARQAGRLAPGERLLVIEDDFHGGGWQVLGRSGSAWKASRSAIRDAMAAL
jgi:hypothetical protein